MIAPDKNLVLAEVNNLRVKLGGIPIKELPSGYEGSAANCPIANAFKDLNCMTAVPGNKAVEQLGWIRIGNDDENKEVEIPQIISDFIVAFDHGAYKELRKQY